MSKENMFPKMPVPEEIQKALTLIWEYSDDACQSSWTKEELKKQGYDCSGEYGIFIRFVLPKIISGG